MTSSLIQSPSRSRHAKPWHVHIFQVVTSACIPSHANAPIVFEFDIVLEEGSTNIAIIKKIVLVIQLLQLKSPTKPTNRKSLCTPLKNALLDLALEIDVKQLKVSYTSCWKPIPKTLEWNLSIMWKLGINGIKASKRNCCAREGTILHRHL